MWRGLSAAAPGDTSQSARTLALLTGGLGVAVLGATMWSLQPTHRRGGNEPAELYNVDRVSKSEGLDQLPADYSKLPPKVPESGPPLPGDLGPAIVNSQQPAVARYTPPGQDAAAAERDARRKEAEAAAGSSVFFRSSNQRAASAPAQVAAAGPSSGLAGFDPQAAGPASTPAQPADPTTHSAEPARPERGVPESRNHGNPYLGQSSKCCPRPIR
ncbi:hypothetical protein PASLES2_16275 [Pseudomonas aeruginosa]